MSRIGKLPVEIPEGVSISIADKKVMVKGKKGELTFNIHPEVQVVQEGSTLVVKVEKDSKEHRALHGTTRAILNNMMQGVVKGYEKRLEIRGVGLRFTLAGKKLNLALGFSHPVEFILPSGITITADEENKNLMIIQGPDKQLVGEIAARIRSLKKPEPYKGKGIRYVDERITLKQGKKAAK